MPKYTVAEVVFPEGTRKLRYDPISFVDVQTHGLGQKAPVEIYRIPAELQVYEDRRWAPYPASTLRFSYPLMFNELAGLIEFLHVPLVSLILAFHRIEGSDIIAGRGVDWLSFHKECMEKGVATATYLDGDRKDARRMVFGAPMQTREEETY